MSKGRIIGIISLKGGVGKTSCTANLGASLANTFQKKVLLVDGNLSAPNLGISFDIANPEFSFQDVLERKANPSQAVSNLTNMDILPASPKSCVLLHTTVHSGSWMAFPCAFAQNRWRRLLFEVPQACFSHGNRLPCW